MVEDFKEENIPDNGIELPIPTKAGYKFDGWYTEENNGSQVNGITKDNLSDIFRNEATVTLYAHWTLLNYTITYEGLNDATNTIYVLPRAKTSRFPEKSSEKRLKMPWVKVQVHRICQSPFWHLFVTPLKMGAKKPESR